MRLVIGALCAVACVACGRVGFETTAVSGDAAGDAIAPITSLIHDYTLANSFADDLGGVPLVGLGGSLASDGYHFAIGQGLTVDNAMPPTRYTVDLKFAMPDVTGYRKVVDFKTRGSDAGLYVYDATLQFVIIPISGCPGNDCYTSPPVFTPNVATDLTLARDSDGTVTAYIDGALQYTFVDTDAVGTLDVPGAQVGFFLDDLVTSGNEAGAGVVTRIRIYDTPLTAGQVAQQAN